MAGLFPCSRKKLTPVILMVKYIINPAISPSIPFDLHVLCCISSRQGNGPLLEKKKRSSSSRDIVCYMYIYIYMYVYVCICMYMYVYACICIYIYVHIHPIYIPTICSFCPHYITVYIILLSPLCAPYPYCIPRGWFGMGHQLINSQGIPCGILHGRHPERIYSFLS